MADVPLLVVSENSSAERRVTPSWSISTLKAKLETVTGIPPSAQRIVLKTTAEGSIPVEASDEDSTNLTAFRLTAYAELHVSIFPLAWARAASVSALLVISSRVDRKQKPRHESQMHALLTESVLLRTWEIKERVLGSPGVMSPGLATFPNDRDSRQLALPVCDGSSILPWAIALRGGPEGFVTARYSC